MGAILAAHEEKAPKRPGQHQLSIRQWDEVCKTINMSLREQQVCKLLFDGMTRQKIAEKLEISNRTVRHHMEQIHLKLEVSNRVGVVLQIIRLRDLLSTPPLISSQVRATSNSETVEHEKQADVPQA